MSKIKSVLCFIILGSVGTYAFADTQCGPYLLTAGNDGLMHINGVKPEAQKLTFLREKEDYQNLKMDWRVATSQPGKWLGLEFVKRNGKSILNAQLLQASMDAPREYATYDCMKVAD